MSNSQVAVPDNKTVAVGSREIEEEEVEETTLSETNKDLGHTKISEKTATFDSNIKKSLVEDHRTQQEKSNKFVKQSENTEVSENRKGHLPAAEPSIFSTSSLTNSSQSTISSLGYNHLGPVKSFEPIQPFAPSNHFEIPESPGLVRQAETTLREIGATKSRDSDETVNEVEESQTTETQNHKVKVSSRPEPAPTSPPDPSIFEKMGYEPVQALSPIDINALCSPFDKQQNGGHDKSSRSDIKEENIKNTLKQIISDLDSYAEKNEEDKENANRIEQDENVPPKPINLEKIFTPADGEQIRPTKTRKMFASSAFYEKGFHPTVEDQVKLAHRISSSLSDISNQSSKGQSMYVNRKKRSVKWVHEGEGRGGFNGIELQNNGGHRPKDPLKLVMNPHGQVQDLFSLRKQGYNVEPDLLSPEVCLEIVKGLHSPKGKGAELFAKRRKRSEKWVVGETNGTRTIPIVQEIAPTPVPLLSPLPPISSFPPPSYLPETAERLQHKQKLDGIQEKFNRPRVKLIRSPWDAALETGSVEAAFVEEPAWPAKGTYVAPAVTSYETALRRDDPPHRADKAMSNPAYNSSSINRIVDSLQKGAVGVDVYKPTLPQGWTANKPSGNYSQVAADLPSLERKSPSPFPTIPDISAHPDDLVIKKPTPSRSPSPFFTIPDIEANPELVLDELPDRKEKSPSPFPNIPDISVEPEQDEHVKVPTLYIPDIFKYLDRSKDASVYRSVTDIKPRQVLTPEFGFALSDPQSRLIENSFSPTTNSNMVSLQSEIFESQGHFNASRSCSPYPVYVPTYEPELEEKAPPSEKLSCTKILIETAKPKDPKYEEHMRKVALLPDKNKSETMMLQQGCFKEFKEKKVIRNERTLEKYSGAVQIYSDEEEAIDYRDAEIQTQDYVEETSEDTILSNCYQQVLKASEVAGTKMVAAVPEKNIDASVGIRRPTRTIDDDPTVETMRCRQATEALEVLKPSEVPQNKMVAAVPENIIDASVGTRIPTSTIDDAPTVEPMRCRQAPEAAEVLKPSEVPENKMIAAVPEKSVDASVGIRRPTRIIDDAPTVEPMRCRQAPEAAAVLKPSEVPGNKIIAAVPGNIIDASVGTRRPTRTIDDDPTVEPMRCRQSPEALEVLKPSEVPQNKMVTAVPGNIIDASVGIRRPTRTIDDDPTVDPIRCRQAPEAAAVLKLSEVPQNKMVAAVPEKKFDASIGIRIPTRTIDDDPTVEPMRCRQAPEAAAELKPSEVPEPKTVAAVPKSSVTTKRPTKKFDDDSTVEPIRCKKAPEAIIGARPLFGQLDINSEFKKAVIDRQKSVQSKRSRDASETVSKSNGVQRVEKSETENRLDVGANSKLETQFKKMETAEVQVYYPSRNEEIEKISYQQEREYHVDFQKVGDEIIIPEEYSQILQLNQNHVEMETEQEDYRKIPVRSLIQSFEQSSMPALKYKQIRDPLPDVVEKFIPTKKPSDSVNEEMSVNMYHVANVEVKSQYYPPDQPQDSSFCKYSSASEIPADLSWQAADNSNGFANMSLDEGSNTLPRCKPKPPPSPTYKPAAYEYEPALQVSGGKSSGKKLDLGNLQNYNTAPRGWGESKNFYKPITFGHPKGAYSDF